jgi:hypothetical protein
MLLWAKLNRCGWCALTPGLIVVLLSGVVSSNAQMGGGHGGRQRNQQPSPEQAPQPTIKPTVPTVTPEPGPRLEIGAILCKSRDDLVGYQTKIIASAGAAAPGRAPDCHIIEKQIAVQIVDRDGPSRTQVLSTDSSKLSGWTNSYLRDTPPSSVATDVGAAK